MPVQAVHLTAFEIASFLSAALNGKDEARDALVKTADFWFWWLIVATVVVAIGCLLEIGEATTELLHWWWHRTSKLFSEDEKRWTIPLSIIGLVLVIVGVGLEGYFEARQASAETAIREYDETGLKNATIKAGTAQQSADAAQADLKEANTQLGLLRAGVKAAGDDAALASAMAKNSKKAAKSAIDAANNLEAQSRALEADLEAEEPRLILLTKNEKLLHDALLPFAEQRFRPEICGSFDVSNRDDIEVSDTWGKLSDILKGANWKPVGSDPSWRGCREHPGIYVFVNPNAPPKTLDAATTLTNDLTAILPPQLMPIEQLPFGTFTGDEFSPYVYLTKDPSLIGVIVSVRPQPMAKATVIAPPKK